MKGVSAIIAIILILMIVIALAALAYTWFSGMFSTLTGGAQTSIESENVAMNTLFRIEMAKNGTTGTCYNVSVTIRNLGTSTINASKMSFYIDDDKKTASGVSTSNIPYGNVTTFTVINTTSPGSGCGDMKGKKLKLITETGLEQSATIQ